MSRHVITKYQPRRWWQRNLRQDVRGLWAITRLFLSAVDVVVTTALHTSPLTWKFRTIRAVLAPPWRDAHPEPHVEVVVIDGGLDERSA